MAIFFLGAALCAGLPIFGGRATKPRPVPHGALLTPRLTVPGHPLSLRPWHLRAACGLRQEERGLTFAPNRLFAPSSIRARALRPPPRLRVARARRSQRVLWRTTSDQRLCVRLQSIWSRASCSRLPLSKTKKARRCRRRRRRRRRRRTKRILVYAALSYRVTPILAASVVKQSSLFSAAGGSETGARPKQRTGTCPMTAQQPAVHVNRFCRGLPQIKTARPAARFWLVSDRPCNVRREGGKSLVIGGPSLVILEGKACNPL